MPRVNPAPRSGAAITTAPRIATTIPSTCFRDGASFSAIAEIAATTAGCRLTRVTDAAIVVRRIDAFQAQKWSASETPDTTASPSSPRVIPRNSRHSPDAARKAATMTSEKPRRQTAIATGSAADRRTSGPAKEIPTTESARTRNGFRDMQKKRAGA